MTTEQQLQAAITAIENLVTAQQQFSADWAEYNEQLTPAITSIVESKVGGISSEQQQALDLVTLAYQQADISVTSQLQSAFAQADTALKNQLTTIMEQADTVLKNQLTTIIEQGDTSVKTQINNSISQELAALVQQLEADYTAADKRTEALSPPIKREPNIAQLLTDYPTLKKTETLPVESPNNKRLIQFDDVRGLVHVSMTDSWYTIPTIIGSRAFPIFYRGLILRFNNNSSYSGNIKMRVYPMGTGGLGLPNNPTLTNHQWHDYETTVTNLYKIGEFSSQYFEGIIEYIELETGWHQFNVNQSDVSSINAKFDVAFGTFKSPFKAFYQKTDGYWYSDDMTPDTPYSIGASWAQDASNPRIYTVTDAESGTDALRFFNDSFDEFGFEVVLIARYLSNTLALTISNRSPNRVYYAGSGRYITDERIYFKRAGSRVTGAIEVESIKMRIPHYG